MREHIYDMWEAYNFYGIGIGKLSRMYKMSIRFVGAIVRTRSKTEAYKVYKRG